MDKRKRNESRPYRLKRSGISVKVKCPRCEKFWEEIFTVKPLVTPRVFCSDCLIYVKHTGEEDGFGSGRKSKVKRGKS